MSVKARLSRPVHAIEKRFDRVLARFARPGTGAPVIEAYLGYAVPEGLVLRGRILARAVGREARPGQGLFSNIRQMLALFFTDEIAGVRVVSGDVETTSDEEGYFTLILPQSLPPGWHDIAAQAEGVTARLPVQVPDPEAPYGVISDVDDTMLQTGAWNIWRNLWTTFSGNALTRRLFDDSVPLMEALSHSGLCPVFYVSSSPWNMHGFLGKVFDRHGLRRGPMFLRDFGVSEGKLITRSHGDHKSDAIDRILAANPSLSFVLVGDTGQHDAQVYEAAARRHPGRIARVVLRAPGPGADAKDMAHVAALRALEVPVYIAPTMGVLIAELAGDD